MRCFNPLDYAFCDTPLKRESNEDVEVEKSAVKRRKTLTPDENQRPTNMSIITTSQVADNERPDIAERLPTEYDSINVDSSADDSTGKTKCPPIELLCRLFPTQKRSVLQLIYKGCNNDLIKTIECVLPSHEKAMASLKYQSLTMGVPRCPQFVPPISGFPPFLPLPMNQHHRLYLPASIASESLPLYNMHGSSTFRRSSLASSGYHSKATCHEYNEEAFSLSQRTCPCCHKDVPTTLRACDSCGHCFEMSPPPRV